MVKRKGIKRFMQMEGNGNSPVKELFYDLNGFVEATVSVQTGSQ